MRGKVPVHTGRVGVLTGQQAGAARAAERVDHEAVPERDPVRDELLLDGRHRRERVPTLVVGQHDDDVRALAPGLGGGGRSGQGCAGARRDERECQRRDAGPVRAPSLHLTSSASRVALSDTTSAKRFPT